jgi:hypothetical protein
LSIEIDLTAQRAWLLHDGQRVYETPISSGRADYPTPTGEFKITEKDREHRSSLYGRLVGSDGQTLVADADADMSRPPGAKFVQAPMKYFLRFDGAVGMHAGQLPGCPASHGCVRLPPRRAALFFNVAEIGTPVRVFGRAPYAPPKRIHGRTRSAAPSEAAPKKRWFPWLRRIAPEPAPIRRRQKPERVSSKPGRESRRPAAEGRR